MSRSIREKEEYWYFRFTERFIFSPEIREMRRVPLVGYKYAFMFLELCAKSIQNGGWIRVERFTSEQSYTLAIAEDIGEDPRDVSDALSYYVSHNLVDVYSQEEYTAVNVPAVENNIGRSSREADRKRLERANNLMLTENALDEADEDRNAYGSYNNIFMTEEEYNKLLDYAGIERTESAIELIALRKKLGYAGYDERESDYEACLKFIKLKIDVHFTYKN